MDPEKERMRLQLCKLIEDWNANRLDLFALSQPNEELEFHGVMRFFFQEAGQKVATKCIRVSSTATSRAVIDALIEKFHPDLRMLSTPKYSLWEVHENGEERQLRTDEKPLLVQLNWHKDDREGRFLLRRDNIEARTSLKQMEIQEKDEKQMKRKLSKRDKKEQKKKEKRAVREAEDVGTTPANLYAEVPPTTFTRTISNPEIVMKKRRERKLAEKLKNIGDGGSLKIYGEEVSGGSKPYVTLLVSIRDRTDRILKEALEKYGIDYQRHSDEYYLAEIRSPLVDEDDDVGDEDLEHRPGQPQTERALDDDDCPLLIYAHDANKANITFHVRRKTPAVAREVEKRRKSKASLSDAVIAEQHQVQMPCLVELNQDGIDSGKKFMILPNVTEIGNDKTLTPPYGLLIQGSYVHARHCVLAFMDGVVTITPCSPNSDLKIDERPISETTILYHGQTIRIGRIHVYRFMDMANVNGSYHPSPPAYHEQAMVLKRTPSEQGMIRSISTPTRCEEMKASVVGSQRFATTFDVDGDVKTFVIPLIETSQSLSANISNDDDGGGDACYAVIDRDAKHYRRNNARFVLITGSTSVPGPQVPDSNKVTIPVPNGSLHRQQPSPAPQGPPTTTYQRRTPPVFGQSAQSGPTRPSTLFGRDAIPAIIELLDNAEEDFLSAVLKDTQAERTNFKLAPAYVIYMCCRYRISPHYRTGMSPEERSRRLAEFLSKVISRMHVTIQDHCHEAMALAFWMANSSELLNFVKLDVELCPCTVPEPQETMAEAVLKSYDHLTACFKQELHAALPALLDLSLDDHASANPCVHMLSGAMSVLRHCRVNAALTIQIFSQLFHYINVYLFNWLVSREGGAYCNRQWGASLRRRLSDIQAWSEKQGLEAAAECRLERIIQASHLLQAQKTMENFPSLCSAVTKLNSLQIRSLLERYRPSVSEPILERELIENLVKVAEENVDEALRLDGQMVQLEEELDLQLSFLIPDDNYTPQVVRGIPHGLREYVELLLQRSICRMILQPTSSGSWTVHMTSGGATMHNGSQGSGFQQPPVAVARSGSISSANNVASVQSGTFIRHNGPEIVNISFQKGDGGIGLSIIQAQGVGQTQAGIYVKNVVPGSSAARDGRLQAGDQLLKVNGQSLVGISQETAAKLMGASGPMVHFEVAKGAVLFNGLATVIYQQSPDISHHCMMSSSGLGQQPFQQQHNAANRVRSVEHLPQMQQGTVNKTAVAFQYAKAPTPTQYQPAPTEHEWQQEQVHHQRYPSATSLQHSHYYQQQQQNNVNSAKAGPPPVQYLIQQKNVPNNYNHGRSMSTSNLKEDTPSAVESRRYVVSQQQAQYENHPQKVRYDAPLHKGPMGSPSIPGEAFVPPRLDQAQHTAEEQYYQNLAQFQSQQQQFPIATGSVARRMSASDYGSSAAAISPHQISGMAAFSSQEYHRLPSAQQKPSMEQHSYSALRNQSNSRGCPSASNINSYVTSHAPSTATYNGGSAYNHSGQYPLYAPYNNGGVARNYNGHGPSNVSSEYGRSDQLVEYQNFPLNGANNSTLSQMPARRPGTPSAHDDTASPQHQQHFRQASYPHSLQSPQYVNHSSTSIRNESYSQQPHQRAPSVVSQEIQSPATVQDDTSKPTERDHLQQMQQRLGHEVAAIAGGGSKRRSVEEEERERQIQAEVERLMREEVARLEVQEFMSDNDHRRYKALKYALEERRRLHSEESDIAGHEDTTKPSQAPMKKIENEFDEILNSLEPVELPVQHDRAVADSYGDMRNVDVVEETSIRRREMRDHYYEEAEHRYKEAVVKERLMRDGESHGQANLHISDKPLKSTTAVEERKRDFGKTHIDELQAKFQTITNLAAEPDEQVKLSSNGFSSHASKPPEVPPKRKVVFNDAPNVGLETEANSVLPSSSHGFPEVPMEFEQPPQQQAPKRYVYDSNPDEQQPRALVIGMQEVYRDPRQERLKNLQQQRKQPVAETEKLSFKDKMRLFAAEIGESTPKERMKASSAQREIEGN